MLDIYTIIFLALAVFIFARLRSVLGQRTGRERPPYDPFTRSDSTKPVPADNVVQLPGKAAASASARATLRAASQEITATTAVSTSG